MDAELFPSSLPVVATVRRYEDGPSWLTRLPGVVEQLRERWSLRLAPPFHGGSCSWVAPAWLPDGTSAVLKVTWPHREAMGEAEGLRIWDGQGAVRLYEEDREYLAVLVERCEPGAALSEAHQLTADRRLLIGAQLLYELWSAQPPEHTGLERLGEVTAAWADLVEERMDRLKPQFDPGLVALGARLLRELPASAGWVAVLHGDFNPGNILTARRKPWLVIDAKPMLGDPGYDVWPLLSQVDDPFRYADPMRLVAERLDLVAGMTEQDPQRLAAWCAAREIEAALWLVEHPGASLPIRSMDRAHVFADLARL